MSERRALADSKQVAEYFGVPLRTVDMWAYHKRGPKYVKVGRHRRYRWSDVEAYLDQQTQATGAA